MSQIQPIQQSILSNNMIMIGTSLLLFIAILFLVNNNKWRTPTKKQNNKLLTPQRQNLHNNIQIYNDNRNFKSKTFQFHQEQYQSDNDYNQSDIDINVIQDDIPQVVVFSIRKAKQSLLKNIKMERKQDDSLVYYNLKQLKQKQQNKKLRLIQQQEKNQKLSTINNKQQTKQQIKKQVKQQIKTKPVVGENKKTTQEQKDKNIPKKQQQKSLFSINLNFQAPVQPTQANKLQQSQPEKKSSSLFTSSVQPNVQQKKQQAKPNINFAQSGLSGLFTSSMNKQQQKSNIGVTQQIKPQPQTKPSTLIPTSTSPVALPAVLLPVSIPTQSPSQPQQFSKQSSSQLSQQLKKISSSQYLQKIILFSSQQKQQSDKQIKLGNFYNTLSNLRQVYDTGIDSLRSIDTNNNKQINTFAIKLFQFIFKNIIPSFGTQQGWERLPPRNTNDSAWKRQLNTYIMKINLYRVMGHQKIWIIIFGKLLKLLQFTWKRTTIIKSHNDLDLIKSKYFKKQGDDMAIKYITRLDLISYFLFTMTTLDPQLYCQYLIPLGHDKQVYEQIKKYKHTWNYNYFWILVQCILKNPINTYFRPIMYLNIISSIYLQVRNYKRNKSTFAEFDVLAKFLLAKGVEQTKKQARNNNAELKCLADQDQDEDQENYTFDGEDFLGQIQTLEFYFKEKQQQYNGQLHQFQRRCCILEYFKKA